jgi:chromosomal replication initiation ATPase DnaA
LDRFESRCEEQFRQILENQRSTSVPVSVSSWKNAHSELESCLAGDENGSKLKLIHNTVAKYFGVNVPTLKRNCRVAAVVLPRQIAIYLIRTHLGLTLNQIGEIYAKDHSTILSAYRKIAKASEGNTIVRNAIRAIEKQLDLKEPYQSHAAPSNLRTGI